MGWTAASRADTSRATTHFCPAEQEQGLGLKRHRRWPPRGEMKPAKENSQSPPFRGGDAALVAGLRVLVSNARSDSAAKADGGNVRVPLHDEAGVQDEERPLLEREQKWRTWAALGERSMDSPRERGRKRGPM